MPGLLSAILNVVLSDFALGVLLAVVLYRVIDTLYIYPLWRSPLRHVPGPSYGHFLWGRFGEILAAEAGVLQRQWANTFGPCVRAVGPFGLERLMFLTPSALKTVTVTDVDNYDKPTVVREVVRIGVGEGLTTYPGEAHRTLRKLLSPAFSLANLQRQSDMYNDHIRKLVSMIHESIHQRTNSTGEAIVHMYPWMSRLALDLICDSAFGFQCDSLSNDTNEVFRAYAKLADIQSGTNLTFTLALLGIPGFSAFLGSRLGYRCRRVFSWLKLGFVRDLLEAMEGAKAAAHQILEQRGQDSTDPEGNVNGGKDIMSVLINMREKTDDTAVQSMLSDEAMIGHILTFLGAGHETTAAAASWAIWLLASHPDIQSKLREEVDSLMSETSRASFRQVKELTYMDCVVMECLRLYPPIPMTFRQAQKDGWVDGVLVPKGTIIYIGMRVVNTCKQVWGEDAEEFKPERWLSLPEDFDANFSFHSFFSGPHGCIGKTMAIFEMKYILLHLLHNFSFSPAYEGQQPQPTAAITMKPADNLPLHVRAIREHPSTWDLL